MKKSSLLLLSNFRKMKTNFVEQLPFAATAPFLLPFGMLYYEKTAKEGSYMANYG